MKKIALFSISTQDFIPNGQIALESFVNNCDLADDIDVYNLTIDALQDDKYKNTIIQQMILRHRKYKDSLRWSLKSAVMLHFLEDEAYENVIYIDNDTYFINNNTFLLKNLDKGILLTKHNRPMYPSPILYESKFKKIRYSEPSFDPIYFEQFLCNFTDGFFNAGFVGASRSGIPAISWWAKMNFWECSKSAKHGLFVDQKYLDILALEFNDFVKICNHPGCNIAVWNSPTLNKSYDHTTNQWKINDIYDPIFCHFSSMDFAAPDPMIMQYYKEYIFKIENAETTMPNKHSII